MTGRRYGCGLVAALSLGSTIGAASADELLWATNTDWPSQTYTTSMSVKHGGAFATNTEVADDFNVVGSVDRVLVQGRPCGSCGQPVVTGAFVRFYEWTPNGPGALQSEQYVPEGDPGFVHGDWPGLVEVALPEPFEASGWHFIAMQLEFDNNGGIWELVQFNRFDPINEPVWFRDHGDGGVWEHDATFWGDQIVADAGIELWGTPGGGTAPVIDSLSHAEIERSGRLRIFGGLWGAEQGDGEVLIDGVPAWVTRWESDSIVAYVPEQASLGATTVEVVTAGGDSNDVPLTVLAREPVGRVKWRFEVDADLIFHRPGIGPDGSVYVNDYNHGRLYKLAADGGLVWIRDTLRGQEGLGGDGPVAVGDDGTVYVGANPLGPTVEIIAYAPDGTLKWVFTNPDAINTLTGPAIGPDGNIYATYSTHAPGQMAVVSLSPDGDLRWFGSGDPFINNDATIGAELAFSASTLGGEIDQIVCATSSDLQSVVYGLSMEDGDTNWSHTFAFSDPYLMQLQVEAATGPSGMVYLTESNVGSAAWSLRARHPADGEPVWIFDPGIVGEVSAPVVGSNGVIYLGWDLSRMSAVEADGDELWTFDGGASGVRGLATVSPDNSLVLFAAGSFGETGFIRALDASTGTELFSVDLPVESPGYLMPYGRGIFTPDSHTAYYPVTNPADGPDDPYAYLYAIDTSVAAEATELTDVAVVFGTHVSGGLPELASSDDTHYRARSRVGFSALEPNLMEVVIGADTDEPSPASLNVSAEERFNQPIDGTSKFRLKNWSTGSFQQIQTFTLTNQDTLREINGLDAASYVRSSDGRIELSIKHVVIATFSAIGFDSYFDLVEIGVE